MNAASLLIILLCIVGIVSISVSVFNKELQCPPPQIIYRYVPANVIDQQFSKENLPSNLYGDMFNNDNIWIGGMSMSSGKTAGLSIPKKNKAPSPFMSMTSLPPTTPVISGPITGPSGL
jgi:hypothetical protein